MLLLLKGLSKKQSSSVNRGTPDESAFAVVISSYVLKECNCAIPSVCESRRGYQRAVSL
jgi:hypothetical protein